MRKKWIFLVVIIIVGCFILSSGYAQAAKEEEQKPWWKKIFSYPVNVVEETANITSDAVKTTVKGTDEGLENVRKGMTGDHEKAKAAITEPITGTGNNVADTAKRIIDMPKKAAE